MMRFPVGPPEPPAGEATGRSHAKDWVDPPRRGPQPRRTRRRLPRWVMVAAGVLLAVVVALAGAFGPWVRSRVASEADKRRLDIQVGAVRPGWFSVTLRDVRVKARGVDGVELVLSETRVGLSASLSVTEVLVNGGEVRVDGDPEDVVDRLRAFREAGGGGREAAAQGSRRAVSATGVSLSWKLRSGGQIIAAGMRASRGDDGMHFGWDRLDAEVRDWSVEAVGGELHVAPDGTLRHAGAASVVLGQKGRPPAPATKPSAPTPDANLTPPPLPAVAKARAPKSVAKPVKAPAVASAPAAPAAPLLPAPDLHALRSRAAVVASTVAARLPEGAGVDVAKLSFKVDLRGELVSAGPGKFALTRQNDVVHVSFASEGDAKSTPLSVDADLPVGQTDVTARISGGPVPLAALGLTDGTLGLMDVGKGTILGKGQVVLAAAGDALTFDGRVGLRSVSLDQPRLSAEPIRGLDFVVSGRGVMDDRGHVRLDDAEVEMGALHVRAHGTMEETTDAFSLSLAFDVAPAGCQALLESIPGGLLPTIRTARMSGTFGASARAVFDTRAIDKMVLDYSVDDGCKVVEVPRELSKERFATAFTYRTYHPDGSPSETTTGPGHANWTSLDDISPFMVAAVLTTEDGAFYKHRGFNHAAIKASVQANLKARRFVRGASTITMQLAKNLFLSRQKTLSRKIEEVLLTDYLEQVFRKDDMMELYLNVVEFGPDVYGITRAADWYFGRKPEELSAAECFFLASILPSPVKFGRLRDKGQVSDGWTRHLHSLLEIASKTGKISRLELSESLSETIVFHRAGEPRPEPRKPVSSTRRDPFEDADWQPLE